MGRFEIVFEELAIKELKIHKKSGNLSNIKSINKILAELQTTPFEGYGKPEALKYDLSGKWSRRINKKDRLTYKVVNNIVYVISTLGHYLDH